MVTRKGISGPTYTKVYVSGIAFGEKSTPDYTWDGTFIENKKLEIKYLPNEVMNQLEKLSDDVSSAQSTADEAFTTANNAQSTADNAQTTAQSALSMLPTVTSTDSGKFLRVSSTGKWVVEAIASAEEANF